MYHKISSTIVSLATLFWASTIIAVPQEPTTKRSVSGSFDIQDVIIDNTGGSLSTMSIKLTIADTGTAQPTTTCNVNLAEAKVAPQPCLPGTYQLQIDGTDLPQSYKIEMTHAVSYGVGIPSDPFVVKIRTTGWQVVNVPDPTDFWSKCNLKTCTYPLPSPGPFIYTETPAPGGWTGDAVVNPAPSGGYTISVPSATWRYNTSSTPT